MDFASLNARSKFWGETQREAFKNWEQFDHVLYPPGERQATNERAKLRELLTRLDMKVMQENHLDVLVRLHTSLPPGKTGYPGQPGPSGDTRGESAMGPNAGLTEVQVPAGFVTTVYDPYFVLSADKRRYVADEQLHPDELPAPGLPFSLVFSADAGREDVILKVARPMRRRRSVACRRRRSARFRESPDDHRYRLRCAGQRRCRRRRARGDRMVTTSMDSLRKSGEVNDAVGRRLGPSRPVPAPVLTPCDPHGCWRRPSPACAWPDSGTSEPWTALAWRSSCRRSSARSKVSPTSSRRAARPSACSSPRPLGWRPRSPPPTWRRSRCCRSWFSPSAERGAARSFRRCGITAATVACVGALYGVFVGRLGPEGAAAFNAGSIRGAQSFAVFGTIGVAMLVWAAFEFGLFAGLTRRATSTTRAFLAQRSVRAAAVGLAIGGFTLGRPLAVFREVLLYAAQPSSPATARS